MPVGEAGGGQAVRRMPAHPPACTLWDLQSVQVLLSLPGNLWSLQMPPEFLCTLPGLSPENSEDPKSKHTSLRLQNLKRIPPIASFHREELGSESSSNCSRSHSKQAAEKMDSELVTLLGEHQERKGSPFSLIPGPLGAQLAPCWGLMAVHWPPSSPVAGPVAWPGCSGLVQQFLFGSFFREVIGGQPAGLFHCHGNFQQWNYENLHGLSPTPLSYEK